MGRVTKNMKIFLVSVDCVSQSWHKHGELLVNITSLRQRMAGITWKTILFCLKSELVAWGGHAGEDGDKGLPTVMHMAKTIYRLASGIIHGKDLMADSMKYFVHLCYHIFF